MVQRESPSNQHREVFKKPQIHVKKLPERIKSLIEMPVENVYMILVWSS